MKFFAGLFASKNTATNYCCFGCGSHGTDYLQYGLVAWCEPVHSLIESVSVVDITTPFNADD